MPLELFAGTWVFDAEVSQMNPPGPLRWVQTVAVDGMKLKVREDLTRVDGSSTTEVDAVVGGGFFPVTGAPIVDEISYELEGDILIGVGRKSGVTALRESVSLPEPDTMALSMTLEMNGRTIPLGTAYFNRQF